MNEQTGYLLLGALIAVTLMLLIGVTVGLVFGVRIFGYFVRFRGLQFSRNAKNEMSFGGVIDESVPAPPARAARIELPVESTDQPATLN